VEDLGECVSKDKRKQEEPYCLGRFLKVGQPTHAEGAQKWECEVESKTLERCEPDFWTHQTVMQNMLGALKLQHSCRS